MEYAIDIRKLDRNLQDLSVGLDPKGNPAFDITLKKMQHTKSKLADYLKQFEPMLEKYLETHSSAGVRGLVASRGGDYFTILVISRPRWAKHPSTKP